MVIKPVAQRRTPPRKDLTMSKWIFSSLCASTLVMVTCSAIHPQAAPPPPPPRRPPPTTTLWNLLGIPQAMNKINANTCNRRGNLPGMEKSPPLLHIADPANLQSPVPAIKAAAEIKQAEDLKPQKIKALKY